MHKNKLIIIFTPTTQWHSPHEHFFLIDCLIEINKIQKHYTYLGRFIRKSAKKQIKRNKADKNINTRRLCGENNITNKKYSIYTAKKTHNNRRKKNTHKKTLMSDQN